MKIDSLMTKIAMGASPCILGLDMGYAELPLEFMRAYSDKADAVRNFNRAVIGAICDIIPAVSVNVAALLPYGTETVADAISYAKEKGLFTIADAKCNGEPKGALAAAELYLDTMDADCITVCPYFGLEGLAPIFERGDKSVFVVARAEYGSPSEVSDLVAGTRSIWRAVMERTNRIAEKNAGQMGYSEIGVSLGGISNATFAELRRMYKKMPFMITGYDGEKIAARDISGAFDMKGLGGLVYVSRVLTEPDGEGAYSERLHTAAEKLARELKICF